MIPFLAGLSACSGIGEENVYPLDGVWEFVRVEVPPERLAPDMTWDIRENVIHVGHAVEGRLEREEDSWYIVVYRFGGARLKVRFAGDARMEIPDVNGNISFYGRVGGGKEDSRYPRDGVWRMTGFTFSGRMSPNEFRRPADLVLVKHRRPGCRERLIQEIDGEYFTRDPITGENIPITLELSENTLLLKYRISNPSLPYDGYNMVYRRKYPETITHEEEK